MSAPSAPSGTAFPLWTHIGTALLFATWSVGTTARLYGIDTRDEWWTGWGDLMPVLILAVLATAMPLAVALEAWALARTRSRWAVRLPVVAYVLVAGFVAFLPTGLRFFGDTDPALMDSVALSLASYAILIGAHSISAYFACRHVSRRILPEERHHDR